MIKKYIFELLIANLIITIAAFAFFFVFNKPQKIVYVDSLKLFNEFRMTKEVMKIGDQELKRGKNHLDSLYVFLNNSSTENEKEIIVKEIANTRETLDQFQKKYSDDNADKIWKRINEYSSIFSKENNYNIIIGKQYEGTIIYADCNVTDELLKYINKKYEGFN